MNKFLKRTRKGIGGVFFLCSAVIGAYIVLTIVNIARTATAVAISDDVAHVVATKAAIELYKTQTPYTYCENYAEGQQCVKTIEGTTYDPLGEFNNLMDELGFKVGDSKMYTLKWVRGAGYAGNGTLIFDVSPFTIANRELGFSDGKIYPHVQQIVIENQ